MMVLTSLVLPLLLTALAFAKPLKLSYLANFGLQPNATRARAVLFRHTFRSPDAEIFGGDPNFLNWNSYSKEPWPMFQTAHAKDATARGLQLAQEFGTLLGSMGLLPKTTEKGKIVAYADKTERDIDTGERILAGLGSSVTVLNKTSFFNPQKALVCPAMSSTNRTSAVKANLQTILPLFNHSDVIATMQGITGRGEAPPLADIKDEIRGGFFDGMSYLASTFAETFLLQFGSAVKPVGW